MSELTAAQIMIIGLVATLIVSAVNLYAKYRGKQLGRRWLTVGLFVISVILGFFWARPLLPIFPAFPALGDDPALASALVMVFLGQMVVWLGELIAAASSLMGFATLIYNTLLKQVVDKLAEILTPAPAANDPPVEG